MSKNQTLIEKYTYRIQRVARKMAHGDSVLAEDLFQEGVIGIMTATSYDAENKSEEAIRGYYMWRARNAMVEYVRKNIESRRVRAAKKSLREIEVMGGGDPDEGCKILEISREKYGKLRVIALGTVELSGGEDVSSDESGGWARIHAARDLEVYLRELTQINREVVVFYMHGYEQKEIAIKYGVTDTRINQRLASVRGRWGIRRFPK